MKYTYSLLLSFICCLKVVSSDQNDTGIAKVRQFGDHSNLSSPSGSPPNVALTAKGQRSPFTDDLYHQDKDEESNCYYQLCQKLNILFCCCCNDNE